MLVTIIGCIYFTHRVLGRWRSLQRWVNCMFKTHLSRLFFVKVSVFERRLRHANRRFWSPVCVTARALGEVGVAEWSSSRPWLMAEMNRGSWRFADSARHSLAVTKPEFLRNRFFDQTGVTSLQESRLLISNLFGAGYAGYVPSITMCLI